MLGVLPYSVILLCNIFVKKFEGCKIEKILGEGSLAKLM